MFFDRGTSFGEKLYQSVYHIYFLETLRMPSDSELPNTASWPLVHLVLPVETNKQMNLNTKLTIIINQYVLQQSMAHTINNYLRLKVKFYGLLREC
jgi:hypothetical protein